MTLETKMSPTSEITQKSFDVVLPAEPTPARRKVLKMKHVQIELDTAARQEAYIAKRKGSMPTLVTPDAFIRGMRDLGYKDPSWALAELIDNSVQAGCKRAEIRFAFDAGNASQAKNPSQIAIVDDGGGMKPEMLLYAIEWGGTDREGDRHGFGRYGYGLPSSCISLARRYTVYSRVDGGDWHSITIDLEGIVNAHNDLDRIGQLLVVKKATLPKWLMSPEANGIDLAKAVSGTVIVLEDLDRLRKRSGWIMRKALKDRLLKQFGFIYRHWLTEVKLIVDGSPVEAIDPLFLLEYARFHNETSVAAKKVSEKAFEVTTDDGQTGTVRIRAALLPPTFSWAKADDPVGGGRKNERWKQVLAPKNGTNGLMVCREGRHIDIVQPDWTKFQNLDVYLKLEIDFDATLDEYFNITTSKQQVKIDETMTDKLNSSGANSGGLRDLVRDMRNEFNRLNDELAASVQNATKKETVELPAANAMVEAERFRTKAPRISDKTRQEARNNFEEKVKDTAKITGESEEQVREALKAILEKRPWDIEFQAMDDGPFFVPKRLGEQKRIVLNTTHPFFSRLYEPATPATKAAIAVLLFVLADGELNSTDEQIEFYRNERRHRWSPLLQHALTALVTTGTVEDARSLEMEREEVSDNVG